MNVLNKLFVYAEDKDLTWDNMDTQRSNTNVLVQA